MSVFRRLIRHNASSVDRPGIDETTNRVRYPVGWHITSEHAPMSLHAIPVTRFYGDVPGPVAHRGPVEVLDTSAPPPVIVGRYGRMRHGEGMWGIEGAIPEGEG